MTDTSKIQTLDFATALKAHADWKSKLRNAIETGEELDEAKVSRDDLCVLGTWLHDKDTQNTLAGLESYRHCKHKHADFHKEIGKVARAINSKNFDLAKQMIATGSEYSDLSTEIAMSLHQLKKDAQSKMVEK
ncbi:hypothetical protein MOMA_04310 [Moraxella macacae 0408225]|uniref:Chemoreceptor zinc-binding domain-containing protein n=1 Tax=Moraxella macacae 0408225 TaxID=1230338 RepID=L2FAY7_9GAMM|nr:CZB domain-containing protein [Moraxella macacae]ELA09598.1 hypothetical protein MOMA_04310 [Moraxella macacae 0408225]